MVVSVILGAVIAMVAIYKITNRLNGKPYVGQTRQPIEKRFMQHLKDRTPLGNAIRQCGLENFTIEVIERCETQAQANERERFWIQVLNTKVPNGYNRLNGGGCGIRKPKAKVVFVMAIGENIKNLRLQHGLSQEELANVAGVSDGAVSSWEQNKSVPRMGAIQKIADYFGVRKSAIIESTVSNSDIPPVRSIKNKLALNLDETKLVSNYRNLNGKNRQAIDVMIVLFLSQQSGGDNFSTNATAF